VHTSYCPTMTWRGSGKGEVEASSSSRVGVKDASIAASSPLPRSEVAGSPCVPGLPLPHLEAGIGLGT
jgi:hypothetical protein